MALLHATDGDLIAFCNCDSHCPVCGDPGDYCQGHGEIGDPVGFDILQRHDNEDHSDCIGC